MQYISLGITMQYISLSIMNTKIGLQVGLQQAVATLARSSTGLVAFQEVDSSNINILLTAFNAYISSLQRSTRQSLGSLERNHSSSNVQ